MGNSMRSFLGNMCGAEDSKRVANEGNDENRPLPNEANDAAPAKGEKDQGQEPPKDESFQTCPVETSVSQTPSKKKHRSGSQRKYHGLYEVEALKPEAVNLPEVDQVFTKSANSYQPFADECLALRKAMDSFEAVFSTDKKRVDFENAVTAFSELLKASADDEELKESSRDKLSAGREHHKTIVTSGYKVLDVINLVRPQMDEDIEAAGRLDPKEASKGTPAEGSQLGLVSKLSVPGKQKRNVKSMKKCQLLLVQVADETQEILAIAERINVSAPQTSPPKASDDVDPQDVTLLERASSISAPIDIKESRNDTHDQGIANPPVAASDPGAATTTTSEAAESDGPREVAASVPLSVSLSNDPSTRPRGASCTAEMEEGRMVDYGSFWMLNPSSDDITAIKRSRSMDSLVSRGSRASMSRYGSYEFVTNMEFQIAEKGEAQRAVAIGSPK